MSSYHDELQALARSIGSDGCTHALEVDVDCCWAHDWMYVSGMTPRGVAVTKAEADQRFRDCLQAQSTFRWLSPLSWWRWLAVKEFGRGHFVQPRLPLLDVADRAQALRDAAAARQRIAREIRA